MFILQLYESLLKMKCKKKKKNLGNDTFYDLKKKKTWFGFGVKWTLFLLRDPD